MQFARYAVVLAIVGYVRAIASVEHFDLGVFVKLLHVALLLALALGFNQLYGAVERDGHRVLVLRYGGVHLVVKNVWSESSGADCHGLAFVFANGAGHLEQFESLFESDGLHTLVGGKLCKARLLVVVGCANLHYRTVASYLYEHRMTALGVVAQLAFARLVLRTCIHHLLYGRLKFAVEVLHHVGPLLLAVGYLVELLLYLGCEVIVHDVGEVLHKEVVHYNTYVGGQQLALLIARKLHLTCRCDDESAQCVDDVRALFAFLVALYNVLTLLYGGDGRCVC